MPIITSLDTHWEAAHRLPAHHDLFLSQGGERDWFPATVPGHIHLDLVQAGILADPFFRRQENAARWVDEADWTYRTTFTVDQERLSAAGTHGRHFLHFHGLDTLARVYLNETLIGTAENMFVAYRFDVTNTLKAGDNTLRVEFDSALRYGQERASVYLGDGTSDRGRQTYFNFPPRAFVRKAQYMFGWDWGPELVSCGMWKPVELVTVPVAEIVDWRIEYTFVNPITVEIRIAVTVEKYDTTPLTVGVAMYAPGDNTPSVAVPNTPGRHTVHLRIPQQTVARWNPNGLDLQPSVSGMRPKGVPQKRYLLNLRLWETNTEAEGRAFLDHKGVSVGFREIELIQEPDADGKGSGFLFRINGVDTFIKGANWIPDSSFPGAITTTQLRQRLTQARDAGFNMLRVWGGGLYESDDFYQICSELGLLVWQDFCFACAMYPDDDDAFVENVRAEAVQAVRRLRNYPCLALWCGGNENSELFQNRWSGAAQATKFYGDRLIHDTLPAVLADEDTHTPYWPNSPYGGDNVTSEDFGDSHYWNVWHSKKPGSDGDWVHYAESTTRFSSEFGFASPCGLTAWESCTLPEDRADPRSPVLQHHDKTRKGYETYLGYIEKHFPAIEILDDLVYYGQANQALALQFGVEHWRRLKGRCWGTLFWQINDCWPVQSWAVIDSVGEPKAAYYACKRFYAPLLVSLKRVGEQVEVHLVNDTLSETEGTLHLRLIGRDGLIASEKQTAAVAPANAAQKVTTFPLNGEPPSLALYAAFVGAEGTVLTENLLFLTDPKAQEWQELPDRELRIDIETTGDGTATLSVKATHFAAFVWLRFDNVEQTIPTFSDNYFFLLPGRERQITVGNLPMGLSSGDLNDHLSVRYL